MSVSIASRPKIAIYSHTSFVPVYLIEAWVAAEQVALDRDFAPHWGSVDLRYVPPGGAIMADEWQMPFFDHSDQANALGYHDLTPSGLPLIKIFLKDCIDGGYNWDVTCGHEIREARVDPDIDQVIAYDGWEYAKEVCDPPEDDSFAVRVAGHLTSNAVTPAWFDPDGKPPFTIYPCPEIDAPFKLAAGGYIGRRRPGGEWEQLMAPDGIVTTRMVKRPTSRTMRRFNGA